MRVPVYISLCTSSGLGSALDVQSETFTLTKDVIVSKMDNLPDELHKKRVTCSILDIICQEIQRSLKGRKHLYRTLKGLENVRLNFKDPYTPCMLNEIFY